MIFLQHNVEDMGQLIDHCCFRDLAERALDTPTYLLLEHHHEQGFLGLRVKEPLAFRNVG